MALAFLIGLILGGIIGYFVVPALISKLNRKKVYEIEPYSDEKLVEDYRAGRDSGYIRAKYGMSQEQLQSNLERLGYRMDNW